MTELRNTRPVLSFLGRKLVKRDWTAGPVYPSERRETNLSATIT